MIVRYSPSHKDGQHYSLLNWRRRISLYLVLWCLTLSFQALFSSSSSLIVHMSSKSSNPVKYLTYCLNCPSPDSEGSIITGLTPKYGLQEYSLIGQVVYCVPNYADTKTIRNAHHFTQKIVFVDRGEVSFYEKIMKIQQQSEAIGVIIADNGDCEESFHYCQTYRIGSVKDGGFAPFDDPNYWKEITIPVLLISLQSAEKLRKLMKIEKQYIQGLGYQNISIDSLDSQKDDSSSSSSNSGNSNSNNYNNNRNSRNSKIMENERNRGFQNAGNDFMKNPSTSTPPSPLPPRIGNSIFLDQDSLNRLAGGSSMNNPFVPPSPPPSEQEEDLIDLQYLEDLKAIDEYHNQLFEDFELDDSTSHHQRYQKQKQQWSSPNQRQSRRHQTEGEFPFDEL